MADRIVLNTISYHGHGAIENIVPELTARGYKKAFVCSDPDLIKFGVTKKVTDLLDAANFAYAVYSEIKPNPTIANVQDAMCIRDSGYRDIVRSFCFPCKRKAEFSRKKAAVGSLSVCAFGAATSPIEGRPWQGGKPHLFARGSPTRGAVERQRD